MTSLPAKLISKLDILPAEVSSYSFPLNFSALSQCVQTRTVPFTQQLLYMKYKEQKAHPIQLKSLDADIYLSLY